MYKAKCVAIGFQEILKQQSDSPTASRERQKMFLMLAANTRFETVAADVRSAYLQWSKINRHLKYDPLNQIKYFIWGRYILVLWLFILYSVNLVCLLLSPVIIK